MLTQGRHLRTVSYKAPARRKKGKLTEGDQLGGDLLQLAQTLRDAVS
jgi:hypothetical protein